jgi:HAD superfamily hydrolase (TIGR01549 family)
MEPPPELHSVGAVEVVFLDAGGVLLEPDWERGSAILARHGIAVSPTALAAAEAVAKREMDNGAVLLGTGSLPNPNGYLGWVVEVSGAPHTPESVAAASQDFEEEHIRNNMWSVLREEVPDALGRLRSAGYRLAVISNAESNLRDRLTSHGLTDLFEALVISAEVGAEKPDPAIFQAALEQMKVAPERALHVGDFYEIDVRGARGAGIPAVLLDASGLSADRDCPRVSSLIELARMLDHPPARS